MELGITVMTDLPFDEAVHLTREALAAQGFGILTEIDVQATMKAKLDVDGEPYLILGACNPQLAHLALGLQPDIGLLLPCNVVVRREGGRTVVSAMDPQLMVAVSGLPDLQSIATQAAVRLHNALNAVRAVAA